MYRHLILYYKPSCPYCQKVLDFMKSKSITVPLRDITQNSDYAKQLLESGGKSQVPCLFIDGRAQYESDDIIYWLQENYF